MHSDLQLPATASTTVDGDAGIDRPTTPPVMMSHNVSGPVDPMEFYLDLNSPPTPEDGDDYLSHDAALHDDRIAAPTPPNPPAASVRSVSQSPVRSPLRPDAAITDRTLSGMRSNPAMMPSRQPGKVKDMANKFDRPAATGRRQPGSGLADAERERYRRPAPTKGGAQQTAPSSGVNVDGHIETLSPDRYHPGHFKPAPQRASGTSFESVGSFSSNGTARTSKSQPGKSDHGHGRMRPLFGEITQDGKWTGNFDLVEYGLRPNLSQASRRASEGSLALDHTRPPPAKVLAQASLQAPVKHQLRHRRSRSDMDSSNLQSMSDLTVQDGSATAADNVTGTGAQRTSRIPVSSGRRTRPGSAASSTPHSRSGSATSNPSESRRLSRSPPRLRPSLGKENEPVRSNNVNPRSRYNPPTLSSPTSNQTLSAKIVAPLPKTSPPLRSSRPRQPVSSAATAASQARANEAQRQLASIKDARMPSEQWLGKPYEPHKDHTRRKIPELDKIDFEERRARIQRAISKNIASNRSMENLRNRSRSASRNRSRVTSYGEASHALPGVDLPTETVLDRINRHQAEELERDIESSQKHAHADHGASIPNLALDTAHVPEVFSDERQLHTPQTDFEDESPILGRNSMEHSTPKPVPREPSLYLSAATYQPPTKKALASKPPEPASTQAPPSARKPQLLTTNISPFRERDSFLMSATDESPSIADSSSDLGRKWAITSPGDEGSIRIMLDEDPNFTQDARRWSESVGEDLERTQSSVALDRKLTGSQDRGQQPRSSNSYSESPVDDSDAFQSHFNSDGTPRAFQFQHDATNVHKRPDPLNLQHASHDAPPDEGIVGRVLDHYQSTGTLTEQMLKDMQAHMVDLHRLSANGGSNAIVVQNLLDSILQGQRDEREQSQEQMLGPATSSMGLVTPDTPTGEEFEPGTVLVYGKDGASEEQEEEDFETKIRKADEEWERRQRGEDPFAMPEMENRPPPPPKDIHFATRTDNPRDSHAVMPDPSEGLRISTHGEMHPSPFHPPTIHTNDQPMVRSTSPAPPLPVYAPPPPPPETSEMNPPLNLPDVSGSAHSERPSSELSGGLRKNTFAASGSSRPSIDSQRQQIQLPSSHSATSFTDSVRQESIDNPRDSQAKLAQSASTGPEHKRLSKRRYIIKELLDTENTYYQDLKIIEDIYKATCTPDLVTPEDKKVLFGNCDEVERFALHFYDEMRKATAQVYVPPKQHRWTNNKRGSFSTTQSDGTGQTSMTDSVDDEKDRTTTIGRAFLNNLPRMEQIYGSYLRNHDAANRRLAALVGTPTVKCWLDECHANASDITAAWDLDSLLVKPTQRVAKYPMLLQQLSETTPQDHPDHEDLKSAARDSISMLTRINEAKKRADLVDQIVNRKRKDSDVRSGIAKAFGRRTEKLKERVGIAEAFQDPEFDELAHKFGGHFIRLQICMRDVQDYMNRTEKAVELVSNYTAALELYTDVWPSTLPEIESKWRRYGQVIRDLTLVAFVEHKAAVQKRVLAPMIQCIKLHDGPQSAINKRKKRIVDYAKCKSDERRGQKPDKKTVEASDMYVALNDQLKIELPKLYNLTASLVQGCLNCFLEIQLQWQDAWQRKLRPLLDAADIPESIKQIEPAFLPDYNEVEKKLLELSICNGTLKQDTAGFLSPSSNAVDSIDKSSKRRPSTLDNYDRTLSLSSEVSGTYSRRHSGVQATGYEPKSPLMDGRIRSNSSIVPRPAAPTQSQSSSGQINRTYSNNSATTPNSTFSNSRPTTGNAPTTGQTTPRISSDHQYSPHLSPRPMSGATYFTARPEPTDSVRFSGIFNSALPPSENSLTVSSPPNTVAPGPSPTETSPPTPTAPPDTPVLFVCASLFEFSIDRTRREGGYPYLTYVQGEVFDVIAQKGELWLAKNQDDLSNTLGWIWEQHFIVLSQE